MGTKETLTTPLEQETWVNEQLGLYSTNSGRRWDKKSDGFKKTAIVRPEMKISTAIKGGKKQITIKKEDLDLIERQAIPSNQIPVLFGAFSGEEPEEQFCIIKWSWFFQLYTLAERGRAIK
jgi:hypothetical protein